MAKPKLALIPATQGSKLYSVLPADGVGDFTFSRNSAATRINKDGLIETVAVGKSRLNYPLIDGVVNGCPSHLLEPERRNYSASSELPSTWTYTEFGSGSAGTITTGKTDMFGGTNAVQIDFPSDAENVGIRFGSSTSGLTSGDASVSVYIKLVESGSKDVQLRCNFTSIVNVNSTEFTRVDLSGTKTNSEAFNLKLRPSEGTSNGGFSIIICHPQEENGSYATSYIPTQGSAVTRVADICNNAGNEQVINSTEGVLYAEISALANDGTERYVYLGNGTTANRVVIRFSPTPNDLRMLVTSGGSTQVSSGTTNYNITNINKIALKYKQNDFALWVNGVEALTDTSGNAPIGMDELSLSYSGTEFKGNVKQIQYFDSALNDSDLETITSWTSFTDMANGQQYSIK